MKRIFKYKLPRDGGVVTITANVVKWLDIQEQNGQPIIWAVVDDEGYESEYEIVAWGTGWEFPDKLSHCRYMGTAQDGAGYVWHYFMQKKSRGGTRAEAGIEAGELDKDYWYWNGPSTITPVTIHDYGATISSCDADSVIFAPATNVYSDCTASIDNVQSVVEYLDKVVANSNTTTLKARV